MDELKAFAGFLFFFLIPVVFAIALYRNGFEGDLSGDIPIPVFLALPLVFLHVYVWSTSLHWCVALSAVEITLLVILNGQEKAG